MSSRAVTTPSRTDLLEIAWWSCRAPSVHNTQPWHWSVDGALELRSDDRRRLAVADPLGRHLVVSGGTALDHAVTAARALGWRTSVVRFPDEERPDLLARIEVLPSDEPALPGVLGLIEQRATDRRTFSSWPVPDVRVQALARVVERRGSHAIPMTDPVNHALVERLVSAAGRGQSPAIDDEADVWLDRGPGEGVPRGILPSGPETRHPANRFGPGSLTDIGDPHGSAVTWLVIGSARDVPMDWLRAGEGLSALWLEASRGGLAVQPVTHILEVPNRRTMLHAAIGWLPHMVLRLGWPTAVVPDAARAGRRPLIDVLDP